MLLKLALFLVRTALYLTVTWYRFAPDGQGKPAAQRVHSAGSGSQARRGT